MEKHQFQSGDFGKLGKLVSCCLGHVPKKVKIYVLN